MTATGRPRWPTCTRRWPTRAICGRPHRPRRLSHRRVFDPARWQEEQPLRVVLIGTDFEVRVWQTLLRIPRDKATTYSDIAATSASPRRAGRWARR